MKQLLIIRQDERVIQILNQTYNDMLAAAKHRRPQAESLIEDEELSQLHDLLVLVRLGCIKVGCIEDYDGDPYIAVELLKENRDPVENIENLP